MTKEISIKGKGPYPVYLPKELVETNNFKGSVLMEHNPNMVVLVKKDMSFKAMERTLQVMLGQLELMSNNQEISQEKEITPKVTTRKKGSGLTDCPSCKGRFTVAYNKHLNRYFCCKCNYKE